MAIIHSPSVPTTGLVYSCDPANSRSFSTGENRLLYSTDLTNGVWGSNGSPAPTRTINSIQAPDGTYTGVLLATGNSLLQDITVGGTVPLTCTMYVKSTVSATSTLAIWRIGGATNANCLIAFNPATGAFGIVGGVNVTAISGSMVSVGDGWWRLSICGVSSDAGHTTARFEIYQGGAFYLWGPQIEATRVLPGGTVPPYVPTTTPAIIRSTTISNLSGTTNNGTLTNNPYYSTNGYGSLLLNGTNSHVPLATPPLAAGEANYTMCAWFYCLQNANIGTIYEQNSATMINHQRSALIQYGASWGFNGESNDRFGPSVRVNTWVMGTIVVEKDVPNYTIRIYEYNNLIVAANHTLLNIGAGGAGIGRKVSTNSEFFNGYVGNVFVYNRSLSQPEINQIYQATRGRYGV